MARGFIIIAALSGLLSVGLGAFGAHALKSRLDEYALGVWETAVQYQIFHSLALLAIGVLCLSQPPSRLLLGSGVGFLVGILVFSGSLYLLSLSGIRWLGAITPLGGLSFMLGWLLLAIYAWQLPR